MVKQVRFCMELIREVFRLKWQEKKSNRVVGQILKISKSTVATYLLRASMGQVENLDRLNSLDDEELRKIIFPDKYAKEKEPPVDFSRIHRNLSKKNVTLMLLWKEELANNPELYSYNQFCFHYRNWKKSKKISMRQIHKAGEKGFIDYAGTTVPIIVDGKTGEIKEAQIFVMSLGASHYTYIEATWSQQSKDFLSSHINALEFFGGVPEIWVPDNLKSGVTLASKYEPEINKSYRELSKHYGAVIIPARVRKPKDKSIVENAVLHVSRKILARIRDLKFFSLEELNDKLWELLEEYNNDNFQREDYSRKSLFDEIEKNELQPLPKQRFEIASWKKAKANIDYHVELEGCYYSIPYKYRGDELTIRHTDSTVEILHSHRRIAVHNKLFKKRSVSTVKEHMPSWHKDYAEWSPSRILNWAGTIGCCCQEICKKIMDSHKHPEQGFRSCMGVISLGKRFSKERLENACKRALKIGGISFKSIQSILNKGLDMQKLSTNTNTINIEHENIRGSNYYK